MSYALVLSLEKSVLVIILKNLTKLRKFGNLFISLKILFSGLHYFGLY